MNFFRKRFHNSCAFGDVKHVSTCISQTEMLARGIPSEVVIHCKGMLIVFQAGYRYLADSDQPVPSRYWSYGKYRNYFEEK